MKLQFCKSYLSYENQIKLLTKRGLKIKDMDYTLKQLSNINYYRLSAYFYPFFEKKDIFKQNTSFEQIIQLYLFDKELRFLLFFAIEKIEVYIRTQMTRVISETNGVFGYTDRSIFHEKKLHTNLLRTIKA